MRWLDSITDSMDMSLSKLGDRGQGSLACCHPWGRKESDTTEQLNNSPGCGNVYGGEMKQPHAGKDQSWVTIYMSYILRKKRKFRSLA